MSPGAASVMSLPGWARSPRTHRKADVHGQQHIQPPQFVLLQLDEHVVDNIHV
jgi:hypothetical protein